MSYRDDIAPSCAFAPSSLPFERAQGRSPAAGAGREPSPAAGWLQRFVDLIFLWHERARGRRQLATLDHRMLADIGIDTATAMNEADRPFWR
jgi:uncharacterized protein YjiS (DUF1127 family)